MFKFLYEHEWNPYRGEYKRINKTKILLIISIVNFIVSLTNLYFHLNN
jgi:hypothetical protein